MHIRRAVVEDCAKLSALALRAKAHWGYLEAQLEAWRPILEVSGETLSSASVFVSEVDRRIVGFYILVPAAQAWDLDGMWVAPESLRRGYGRSLVLHALKTVAAGGAAAIRIDADPHAEPFYAACGAVRVGEVAAPIAGQPDRVRPQLLLATTRSNISLNADPPVEVARRSCP